MLNRAAALIGVLTLLVLLDGCRAIPVASARETRHGFECRHAASDSHRLEDVRPQDNLAAR